MTLIIWASVGQNHPRQPLTGDLKMHFRFGARIFTAASNLTSKWTPVFPLLARIWDIRQSLLIKFFVVRLQGESGKGIHRNLQANGKWIMFFCLQQLHSPLDWVNLGQNSELDRGQLTRLFLFCFKWNLYPVAILGLLVSNGVFFSHYCWFILKWELRSLHQLEWLSLIRVQKFCEAH